jgi:hypothetical protein
LQHVLEIAGQLFLLEQLLRVDMLVAQLLVLDAIDQSQALAAVDGFARNSMNCCGLRLKSFRRPLPVRMLTMVRG